MNSRSALGKYVGAQEGVNVGTQGALLLSRECRHTQKAMRFGDTRERTGNNCKGKRKGKLPRKR